MVITHTNTGSESRQMLVMTYTYHIQRNRQQLKSEKLTVFSPCTFWLQFKNTILYPFERVFKNVSPFRKKRKLTSFLSVKANIFSKNISCEEIVKHVYPIWYKQSWEVLTYSHGWVSMFRGFVPFFTFL